MNSFIQKLARQHRTPWQVQKLLHSFEYNREENGTTLKSALKTLQERKAHCLEAAFAAAALLELNGYPPLVMSLESQDGIDHVVFIFREEGRWGAVGHSRDPGLFGRAPVFRSLRDLAWSYYDPYIDGSSKVTAYQMADLDDTEADWRYSSRNVWKAEKYLLDIVHRPLRSSTARYQRVLREYLKNGVCKEGRGWW